VDRRKESPPCPNVRKGDDGRPGYKEEGRRKVRLNAVFKSKPAPAEVKPTAVVNVAELNAEASIVKAEPPVMRKGVGAK